MFDRIQAVTCVLGSLACLPCSGQDVHIEHHAEVWEHTYFEKFQGHLSFNAVTSDGGALYFTRANTDFTESHVFTSRFEDGNLNEAVLAGFSTGHYTSGASLSEDESRVLFTSLSPTGLEQIDDAWNVWSSTRSISAWSPAVPFAAPVNSNKSECCAVYMGADEFLFSSERGGSWDIYHAVLDNSGVASVSRLPDTVNSDHGDWPSSFDPGSGVLLFSSTRPQGYGGDDIYMAKLLDGKWLHAKLLPESVNTAAYEDNAVLGADGEWMYFSSRRPVGQNSNHSRVYRIKASILKQNEWVQCKGTE